MNSSILNKKYALCSTYFLFYAGISIYRVYYSIWTERQDMLYYFTTVYTMQTTVNIVLFLSSTNFLRNIKRLYTLLFSIFISALGIFITTLPGNLFFTIIAGILMGLGLLMFFHQLNSLLKLSSKVSDNFLYTNVINNLGRLFGIGLVTCLYYYLPKENSIWNNPIHISVFFILVSCIPLFSSRNHLQGEPIPSNKISNFSYKKLINIYKKYPEIIRTNLLINFLAGLALNILLPYLPVILYRSNETLLSIGITMMIAQFMISISHITLLKIPQKQNIYYLFLASNTCFVALLLVMQIGSILNHKTGVILFYLLFSTTGIIRRLLANKSVPREILSDWNAVTFLGYLTGNIFGTILGAYFISSQEYNYAFTTSAIIMFITFIININFIHNIFGKYNQNNTQIKEQI